MFKFINDSSEQKAYRYARRFHTISKFKGHLFIGIFTEISGSLYYFMSFTFVWIFI